MNGLMQIKFFYDNYTNEQICGMFTPLHIMTVLVFFISLGVALYFSKKISEQQVKKLHFIIAVVVSVLEILKITLRICKGQWYDDWVPLYFCSLFIFAIWISLSKNEKLNKIGYSYITMGGILASLFFTFYPSTSLALFPIWHPASIHSFVYHWIMFYTGMLFLMKKQYTPTVKDALKYFIFILIACVPSYFLNETLGTNCMFLRDAFKLPILDTILQKSKVLYMIIVIIGQSVVVYWLSYGVYKLVIYINKKLKEKNNV